MLVFSAFPIANLFLGFSTKDYGLWYQVGLAVRQGLDIYPRPETDRLFPFMYPPSAAAMLGVGEHAGPHRVAAGPGDREFGVRGWPRSRFRSGWRSGPGRAVTRWS